MESTEAPYERIASQLGKPCAKGVVGPIQKRSTQSIVRGMAQPDDVGVILEIEPEQRLQHAQPSRRDRPAPS